MAYSYVQVVATHYAGIVPDRNQIPRRGKTMTTENRIKGAVAHAYAINKRVEIWVPSPTGDSSDSHTFVMPCLDDDQAQAIAEMWRTAWGIK